MGTTGTICYHCGCSKAHRHWFLVLRKRRLAKCFAMPCNFAITGHVQIMNSFSHSIFKPIIQACRQLRIQPLNHSLLLSSPKVMHSSLHLFSRSLTHSVIRLSQQPFLSALHALSSFRQFAVSAFSQLSPIWLWVKSLHEYRQLSILKMNTGLGGRWWFGPVPGCVWK